MCLIIFTFFCIPLQITFPCYIPHLVIANITLGSFESELLNPALGSAAKPVSTQVLDKLNAPLASLGSLSRQESRK